MSQFASIINATVHRYMQCEPARIMRRAAILNAMMPPGEPREPKPYAPPFIPPPRHDFPELRKKIYELSLEVEAYRDANSDDPDWCEREESDDEIELRRLEDELSHLESTADMIGALSAGARPMR